MPRLGQLVRRWLSELLRDYNIRTLTRSYLLSFKTNDEICCYYFEISQFPAAAIAAVAVAHTRTKARRWRELALGSPVVPSGLPRPYTQENAGYGQKEEKNFAYQNLTDDTLGTSEYLAWPLGPTITITMTRDWRSIILTS